MNPTACGIGEETRLFDINNHKNSYQLKDKLVVLPLSRFQIDIANISKTFLKPCSSIFQSARAVEGLDLSRACLNFKSLKQVGQKQ